MSADFFSRIGSASGLQQLLQSAGKGGVVPVHGASAGAQPMLAAALRRACPDRTLVIVTEGVKSQEAMLQDLETWLGLTGESGANVFFFPAWEVLPHESRLPHADVISERLETLQALLEAGGTTGAAPVVVATGVALMQRTFSEAELRAQTRRLSRGERLPPLDLVELLEDLGYEPEAQVTQKGELALRGGIVDVFPLTSPWPVRIEFFGDEIESMRYFDPGTQVSREEIASIALGPAGELGFLRRRIEAKGGSDGIGCLADYLAENALVVLCEPEQIEAQAEAYFEQAANDPLIIEWGGCLDGLEGSADTRIELRAEAADDGSVSGEENPAGGGITLDWEGLDPFRPIMSRLPEPQVAEAQRREFFAQVHRWRRQGRDVLVVCNNDGERQRFEEVWREYGFEESVRGELELRLGALSRGFHSADAGVVVLTDAEIFGRYRVQRPRRLKSPHAAASRSALDIDFTEFEEGDLVVHVQHGIGRFAGLKSLPAPAHRTASTASDRTESGQECLVIEYAAGDPDQPAPRLYVPITEAHLVSKYVGAGKSKPPLNTLGGTRWIKAKAQAEEAVRDLAGELLSIQAARESQPGHGFESDTPWQREFESAFLYEETPDQMRAIVETKKDMETSRPMDRLICGDVGYGKTEVAIRAAFKSVMGGRQVALLVPTTVLAQQHFNTFRERMADYPVRIEQLSRFRTRSEQRRVLQALAEGSVDIVIGTHRLIQEDVQFKDLGLVIIDEEQRFGVLHKEKFKLMRRLVDVLTLSATPIPRTLYLALTGARDMSTIETPPQDRLPVETIVAQYDERLIRDAIQRELNRGGQVYFLHNRVGDIDEVAQKLKALVPSARLLVGHGQMDSDDLEEIMARFVNGEADVLVSTTIIESGIDIPNANTIIIDRADRFGLSDLYQLRGRVGRYKHQAYAYLLLPRHAALLSDVRKRITAIKQYSSLGSGFKIAMRDLEIRGAGNLLGPQQSGHITAVGFELYCQLLKQSVAALKGEKVRPRVEVQARIDFLLMNPAEEAEGRVESGAVRRRKPAAEDNVSVPREVATYADDDGGREVQESAAIKRAPAFIPHRYIPEARHRIEVYRKLAQASEKAALMALKREIRDRFGPLPPAVELLVQLAELRILAMEREIESIETKGDRLMLSRRGDYVMVGGRFPRLRKREAAGRMAEIKKVLLALGRG